MSILRKVTAILLAVAIIFVVAVPAQAYSGNIYLDIGEKSTLWCPKGTYAYVTNKTPTHVWRGCWSGYPWWKTWHITQNVYATSGVLWVYYGNTWVETGSWAGN